MSLRPIFCLFIVLMLVAPGTNAEGLHATYVTASDLELERVLPPPPAPDSPEQRADLAAVVAAVEARTPTDEARIVAQYPCTAIAFAGDILGPDFSPAKTPLTLSLVEHAFEDAELAVIAAKQAIGRPRPYTLLPDLRTFGHRSSSAAYPSGHATCGRVMAVILAAMVPTKADALFARGELYGRNRLIAGTHFPSDLVAGATAGSVVAEVLFRSARFESDFAKAEAEMRAALHFSR